MQYLKYVEKYIKGLDKDILFDPFDKSFWQDEMGLDYEEINEVIKDKESIKSVLNKSKIKTFTLESLYFLLENEIDEKITSANIIEMLSEKIEDNISYINIIAMIYFLDGMNSDGIKYVGKSLLSENEINSCIYSYRKKDKLDIAAFAILIFTKSPKNLFILEASQVIINRKFNDYIMMDKKISDDDIDVNRDKVNDVLDNGIENKKITNDLLKNVLQKVESKKSSNFSSKFIDSISIDNNRYVVIFREYQRTKLRTLDEGTFVANEAEIVILKFNKYSKICSIIAHEINEEIALEVANNIIQELTCNGLEYVEANEYTDKEDLKKFINYLLEDLNSDMKLHELYFEYSPLNTSPTLILRSNDYETGLKNPLKQLKNKYSLDLLFESINLINKIKVAYKLPDRKNDRYRIIKLLIEEFDSDKFIIKHSMYNMDIKKEEKFKNKLKDKFGMIIYG
ncbi:MAG: hypothetical protein ACOCP8_08510 [archaeon]